MLADTGSPRPGRLNPTLSWSHYRYLLRVDRQVARDFYEIEAIKQTWPVRELSRQSASLLFDRLAKSRDCGHVPGRGIVASIPHALLARTASTRQFSMAKHSRLAQSEQIRTYFIRMRLQNPALAEQVGVTIRGLLTRLPTISD